MVKNAKYFKEKEAGLIKDFAKKNKCWVLDIDISNYVSEGAEQKGYLKDNKTVLKSNDTINTKLRKIILSIFCCTTIFLKKLLIV